MDSVTAILIERARETRGVRPMVAVSTAVHLTVAVLIALAPGVWTGRDEDAPRTLMTISLGGSPGPMSGGSNQIGGRAIQKAAEPDARPEPVRAPAARTPDMTMPLPNAKPAKPSKQPPPVIKEAPKEARGQTPSTGAQERFGSTLAETGGYGFGSGISTGGGGTGGYLDVGNFCCPEYLTVMMRVISQNWNSRQGVAATTIMKFTIQRDGRLTNVELEQSSGYTALDIVAQRALLTTRQLPPLPAAFPDSSLTVHLKFDYQR